MAPVLRLAALALLCVPAASACSLAHQPFSQPSWETALHYVDFDGLHRVDGVGDRVLARGYFLGYGTAGDLLLVAGQEGLGADCGGSGWLRLQRGMDVLWEKAGESRVWGDPGGPIAEHGGAFWRLQGTELVKLPAQVPQDAYVLGWTPEAKPVYRGLDGIVVGAVTIPRDDVASFEPNVARTSAATGVSFNPQDRAVLAEVTGSRARSISWPAERGYGGLAWADGWYVLQGGRVYLVRDGVVDLGVEAVSLGSQGRKAVVFSEDGYTLFEGTTPVAAARRVEGGWLPVPAGKDVSTPVAGAKWGDLGVEPAPEPNPPETRGPVLEIPAPGTLVGLACLGLALASRRRGA